MKLLNKKKQSVYNSTGKVENQELAIDILTQHYRRNYAFKIVCMPFDDRETNQYMDRMILNQKKSFLVDFSIMAYNNIQACQKINKTNFNIVHDDILKFIYKLKYDQVDFIHLDFNSALRKTQLNSIKDNADKCKFFMVTIQNMYNLNGNIPGRTALQIDKFVKIKNRRFPKIPNMELVWRKSYISNNQESVMTSYFFKRNDDDNRKTRRYH